MPSVIDHLHYRIVDVSSIKELCKRWYGKVGYYDVINKDKTEQEIEEAKPHR
jgi:oligoribonuclease (3'-5' exoribonuclease)